MLEGILNGIVPTKQNFICPIDIQNQVIFFFFYCTEYMIILYACTYRWGYTQLNVYFNSSISSFNASFHYFQEASSLYSNTARNVEHLLSISMRTNQFRERNDCDTLIAPLFRDNIEQNSGFSLNSYAFTQSDDVRAVTNIIVHNLSIYRK